MANLESLKSYVAYYVSRGKPVVSARESLLPFQGIVYQCTGYHIQFQSFWQQLQDRRDFNDLYLDGDLLSFGQLLDGNWMVGPCARCDLPIPIPVAQALTVPSCSLCDESLLRQYGTRCPAIADSTHTTASEIATRVVIIGSLSPEHFKLKQQLRLNGFDVQFIEHIEAVTHTGPHPVDLILIEADASEAEARAWARQIRQYAWLQKTPIVVLSDSAGDGLPWVERSSLTQVYEDYLLSPWNGEHLMQHLRNLQQAQALQRDLEVYWFPRPPLPSTPAGDEPQSSSSLADGTVQSLLLEQHQAIHALTQDRSQLRQQVQDLETLNSLKDDFLNTVSHELRTPMTNIKMAIQMLEIAIAQDQCTSCQDAAHISPGRKISHYLAILKQECEREIHLINELLDLQRLESNRHTLTYESIELQNWLLQIVSPFRERARQGQEELLLQLSPDLPQTLTTDASSLERILTELLNNACKYTPCQEQIILTVRAVPPHIRFEVRNSGIEIPAADLPYIFDKFYRVREVDQRNQGGTGLGLALVRKLIEQLQGKISVESCQGQTCFAVELPLQPVISELQPETCDREVPNLQDLPQSYSA